MPLFVSNYALKVGRINDEVGVKVFLSCQLHYLTPIWVVGGGGVNIIILFTIELNLKTLVAIRTSNSSKIFEFSLGLPIFNT